MGQMDIKDFVAQYESISNKYKYLGYPEDQMRMVYAAGDYMLVNEKASFSAWILDTFFAGKLSITDDNAFHKNLLKWLGQMRNDRMFLDLCLRGFNYFKDKDSGKARPFMVMYGAQVNDKYHGQERLNKYDFLLDVYQKSGYSIEVCEVMQSKALTLLGMSRFDESTSVMNECLSRASAQNLVHISLMFSQELAKFNQHERAFNICLSILETRKPIDMAGAFKLLEQMEKVITRNSQMTLFKQVKNYVLIQKYASIYRIPSDMKKPYKELEESMFRRTKSILGSNTSKLQKQSEDWLFKVINEYSSNGLDVPDFIVDLLKDYCEKLGKRSGSAMMDLIDRIEALRSIDSKTIDKLRKKADKLLGKKG